MTQAVTKPDKIFQVSCLPGIKRDGTQLDGDNYSDGEWVRFRLGRPKKIGGYRSVINGLTGPIRALWVTSQPANGYIVNSFSSSKIETATIDDNGGGGSPITDRTPVGFVSDTKNSWQVDEIYDSAGGGTVLVAHAATNLVKIDDDNNTPVYYGFSTASTALTSVGQSVSGGCVILQPYLFIYGNNGLIKNSAVNQPTDFASGDANAVNVAGTKVVKGLAMRGGGTSPAGLFWSLDSLIRVTYVGGTAKFKYDTVSSSISVLSSNAIIEYDGVFYWPSVDRFLMYNGTIKEVPNQMNMDYFFDNLNWDHRQKVSVMKMPRHGEIWWLFPKGSATEVNHAIIYNVRENTWYDTPITRSAGISPKVFRFPLLSDSVSNNVVATDKYRVWMHEIGQDNVYEDHQEAIHSWFETADLSYVLGGPAGDQPVGDNIWARLTRIEPDFNQVGDMSVQVTGKLHPASAEETSDVYSFTTTTAKVDLRVHQRLFRLRFDSNSQGGSYHMGKTLLQMEPGDIRE